ncbi:hypothetical protein Z043_120241, partial [Scleropages formosus]
VLELALDVDGRFLVAVLAFIVGEADGERDALDLLCQQVLLVEEEDERSVDEPVVVADGVKETKALCHATLYNRDDSTVIRPTYMHMVARSLEQGCDNLGFVSHYSICDPESCSHRPHIRHTGWLQQLDLNPVTQGIGLEGEGMQPRQDASPLQSTPSGTQTPDPPRRQDPAKLAVPPHPFTTDMQGFSFSLFFRPMETAVPLSDTCAAVLLNRSKQYVSKSTVHVLQYRTVAPLGWSQSTAGEQPDTTGPMRSQSELEVVATKFNTEDDGSHALEAVDPLLPFRTLASHVHHFEGELLEGELVFHDAGGHVTGAQDVLHCGDILCASNAVQVVEIVGGVILQVVLVGAAETLLYARVRPEALHYAQELRRDLALALGRACQGKELHCIVAPVWIVEVNLEGGHGTDDACQRIDGIVQNEWLVLLAGLQVEASAVDNLHLLDNGAFAGIARSQQEQLDLASLPLALRAQVPVDAARAPGCLLLLRALPTPHDAPLWGGRKGVQVANGEVAQLLLTALASLLPPAHLCPPYPTTPYRSTSLLLLNKSIRAQSQSLMTLHRINILALEASL